MADITNEIAAIQVATNGSAIRSAIVNALSVLNDNLPVWYSGAYTITPSTSSIVLSVSGKTMTSDLTIAAFPGATLVSSVFSSNGTYYASSYSADGFDQVVVSIPYYDGSYDIIPSDVSQSFPTAGLLMSADLLIEAYSSTVSLISATFSSNGVYLASSYSADGFDQVTVAISAVNIFHPSLISSQHTFINDHGLSIYSSGSTIYFNGTKTISGNDGYCYYKISAIFVDTFRNCKIRTVTSDPRLRILIELAVSPWTTFASASGGEYAFIDIPSDIRNNVNIYIIAYALGVYSNASAYIEVVGI